MTEIQFDPDNDCADGIFGLPFGPSEARVVLVPVPFDATTSYRTGTARAPLAICNASMQVDLHDLETGDPWKSGIAMLPTPTRIEELNHRAHRIVERIKTNTAIDVEADHREVNLICDEMTQWVKTTTWGWLDQGRIVGVIGGDHSTPLGSILAHSERYSHMGLLHIDAHADLRQAYQGFDQSHASIMYNVLERAPAVSKLVQVGVRDTCSGELKYIEKSHGRVTTWFDIELSKRLFEGQTFSAIVDAILEPLPEHVYVSFDIDGLEPSLCAGTGTPVPGGLSFQQATYLLARLKRSGRKVVGFDLCEVAGGEEEEIDAIVGARVLYKLIGWSLLGF